MQRTTQTPLNRLHRPHKRLPLVSRERLFNILLKIECPQKLHNLIRYFHNAMKATIQFEENNLNPLNIKRGVKHGCFLAPTTFFSMVLKHTFETAAQGI